MSKEYVGLASVTVKLTTSQNHPQKQSLECVGCQMKFTKAAQLMSHIENDECKVIRLEHFERQRAEKQILKDSWESVLCQSGGSQLPSHAGASLADTSG